MRDKNEEEEERGWYEKGCRFVTRRIIQPDVIKEREKREKRKEERKKKIREEFHREKDKFDEVKKEYSSRHPKYRRAKERYEIALKEFEQKKEEQERSQIRNAIDFAGLELEPFEAKYFAYFMGLVVFLITLGVGASIVFLTQLSLLFKLIGLFPMIIGPIITIALFRSMPMYFAKRERARTIGRMPRSVNYMVMAMSLTPNLGRAVEYAAKSVGKPLSTQLWKVLWDAKMGKHDTVEDSLLDFADKWGQWSESFRRSLYTLRNAAHKRSQEGVNRALNEANDIAMEGAQTQMKNYAESLSAPSMALFGVGTILPLLIAALLPIFAVGELGVILIIAVMDIIIPLGFLIYAHHIIGFRPTLRAPLDMPPFLSIHEKLVILGGALAVSIPLVVFGALWMVSGAHFMVALVPLWGVALGISIYCYFTSYLPYKKRENVLELERNLPDALFHLGGRIGRGTPLERAFNKVAENLPPSGVVVLFRKISYLLHVTRKSLDDVLFGPSGLLQDNPSQVVRAYTTTIARAIKKDPETAGETLVTVSGYLNDMSDIEKEMERDMSQITGTMTLTALFIAPLVLGITTILYKVLAFYFSNLQFSSQLGGLGGLLMGSGVPLETSKFILVMGIYLICLDVVTVYFTVGIESGDDWVARKKNISQVLPISMGVFTLAGFLMQILLGGMV